MRIKALICLAAVCGAAFVASAEPIARFGVITDLHHTNKPDSTSRAYSGALGKCQAFVDEMNAADADFVIQLGDFLDRLAEGKDPLANLNEIESIFTGFKGPHYHVLGNHEFGNVTRDVLLRNLSNDDPSNLNMVQPHYSFDAGGVHCVVLDADYTNDAPHTPFDMLGEGESWWNWKDAYVPEAQRQWLADDLAASDLPTFVFTHQTMHRDNAEAHNIKNADAVQEILEADGDVLAVFSGHDHCGEHAVENGIHYFVLRGNVGISRSWEDLGLDPSEPGQAFLDVDADNQYALVEVTDLGGGQYRIDITGNGYQASYSEVVPEPATMALLGLGGLVALRRHRR